MKSEVLTTTRLAGNINESVIKSSLMAGEIEGVIIDYFSIRGADHLTENADPGYYNVILSLKGKAQIKFKGKWQEVSSHFVVRVPYMHEFTIEVADGDEFHFVILRKRLDDKDLYVISRKPDDHSSLYIKSFSECPIYTEEIKSSKTINRTMLPVGLIPRFCIGSVETTGPDSVGEHDHPMLDQLFLGLENCRCTCTAGEDSILLTENMILHIPLGSKHSVSVAKGDLLSYIWFDFFFALEGEDYIGSQHKTSGD